MESARPPDSSSNEKRAPSKDAPKAGAPSTQQLVNLCGKVCFVP